MTRKFCMHNRLKRRYVPLSKVQQNLPWPRHERRKPRSVTNQRKRDTYGKLDGETENCIFAQGMKADD